MIKSIVNRRMMLCAGVLTMSALTFSMRVWAEDDAVRRSEAEASLERYVRDGAALWERRRVGQLSEKDWEGGNRKLRESEVEKLRDLMPESLEVLGRRLVDRKEKHLCDMAMLAGRLGDMAPKKVVDVLFGSVLPSEEADELCFIRAFMNIGPDGYEFILKRVAKEGTRMRVYYAVMALVVQAKDTDFPAIAGLGPQEEWDSSLPKSGRGLRRLAGKWGEWWVEHKNEYTWEPNKGILERK